jgi:hypothetical protein
VFTIFAIYIPLTQDLNLAAKIVVEEYLNIVSKGTFFTGRLYCSVFICVKFGEEQTYVFPKVLI